MIPRHTHTQTCTYRKEEGETQKEKDKNLFGLDQSTQPTLTHIHIQILFPSTEAIVRQCPMSLLFYFYVNLTL
jgi:hypothetical protein